MNRGLIAWAVVAAYVFFAAVGVVVQAGMGAARLSVVEGVGFYAGFGLFAGLGALLIVRRPGHVMGVLFATMALVVAIGSSGDAYAGAVLLSGGRPSLPVRVWAWPNAWYWYALLTMLVVYVPLLFPDGHLPSPRWRWFAWPVGVAAGIACALAAVSDRISLQSVGPDGEFLSVVNPFGIDGVPHAEQNPVFMAVSVVVAPGLIGAVAAVVVRFRRSTGVERQQIKWFVAAVCLLVVAILVDVVPIHAADVVGGVGLIVAIIGLPASITLAILRWRLYEIDRIVSRTVTYALVTAVLLAVYAAIATLPGALFGLESDLLVAAATLAAAAAFVPVRRRVQAVVDRRFNRTRYDAVRVVEGFGSHLRGDLDLDGLRGGLRRVVASTMQPSHVSLRLRDGPRP
ncbi:MAG TPA: hypothetical protein VK891_10705 [Euzebyales bacterium]|nr:hypothetical protein [Euzebyales bacterium]